MIMAKSTVREKLEEYFSSMTPTSSRLMADIKNLKQGFNCNWEELDAEQQSDILWKAIVKPEAIKMYENIPENSVNVEYFPVLRIRPGAKIIVEDDNVSTRSFGNSWRDEHSSPFRWETMSQLGLDEDEAVDEQETEQPSENAIEESSAPCPPVSSQNQEAEKDVTPKKTEVKKEEDVKKAATIKRPEVPPPPVPPHASPPVPRHITAPSPPPPQKNETPIYAKVMKRKSLPKTLGSTELKALRKQREEIKPAVPPRMSLELKGSIDVTKYKTLPIDIDDIPKTGFDFLDNW